MTQNLIPLAQPADNPLTMSSREIADLTGKQHKDVIRDIRVMLDALQKDGADLRHVREDKDARGYTAMFHLNRELTDTLLTGYSIPLRRKVIARWHELEAKVAAPDLSTDEGKLLTIQDLVAKQLALLADNKRIQLERDEAIRTKAQIGDRKTATAMATASAATKKAAKLEIELDRSRQYATVKRMEMLYHGQSFNWRLLKSASADVGMPPVDVFDANYGKVKAYHADAWMEAYALPIVANDYLALEQ